MANFFYLDFRPAALSIRQPRRHSVTAFCIRVLTLQPIFRKRLVEARRLFYTKHGYHQKI